MKQMTYIEAITRAMDEALAQDDNVFIIGEDVGAKGGVFKATVGLYDKYGEQRVIDAPLAESAIVGVAIGASMVGKRPIAEIQFADFIMPAINQIVSEAAKMRYRSNNDWSCPLVVRAPFGGGVHGALYHSQSVEAMFAGTPGLKIVIPSTPYDAKGLLAAAILDPDPVLYFEHKKAYRLIKGAVPEEHYTIPIGKADVKHEGDDITVITYGLMVHYSLQAIDRLKSEGISVHLVDLRTVYPLDKEGIIEAACKTGKVLLITEDNKEGSIIGEVAAIIAEHCLFDLDAPIMRLAAPNVPAMPYAPTMEKHYMVNPEKIETAMRHLAAY